MIVSAQMKDGELRWIGFLTLKQGLVSLTTW